MMKNTVTVICRLPSGLVLDLYDTDDLKARAQSAVPVMAVPLPRASVKLNGARHDPRFHGRDNLLLGMGGRTEIDAGFWAAWCAQNPDYPPLKNGLLFAQAKSADALAELAERGKHRTGLEGLDRSQLQGVEPLQIEPA